MERERELREREGGGVIAQTIKHTNILKMS